MDEGKELNLKIQMVQVVFLHTRGIRRIIVGRKDCMTEGVDGARLRVFARIYRP